MGQNRYRVPEVSGIGSISKYWYRQKLRYRYRVLSILFRYFTSTCIIRMSCSEIQTAHNNLDFVSLLNNIKLLF